MNTNLGSAVDEALGNVNKLEWLGQRLTDEQPFIEAFPASVTYTVNLDTNFEDREAFVTGFSKYLEEATVQSDMNLLLEEGETFAVMLYTWRCISKAIPSVKDDNDPKRMEIYEKTVQVMEMEINKLKAFYHFKIKANSRFCEEIKKLAHPQRIKDFISETHLVTLGKLINMFAVLDALKDMKAAIPNDFTHYKRTEMLLGKTQNDDPNQFALYQQWSMFFAQRKIIMQDLSRDLRNIEHYEEVLAEIVNTAAKRYENHLYLTPKDKHMLLKVVAFGLYLIDSSPKGAAPVDKKYPSLLIKMNDRSLSISRFDKLFKTLPVVPLYGDMHIELCKWVEEYDSYKMDNGKWTCVNKDVVKTSTTQFNLVSKLEGMRTEYQTYIAELMKVNSLYRTDPSNADDEEVIKLRINDNAVRTLFDLASRGLRFLSECSATLMELYYWKLSNPRDQRELDNQFKKQREDLLDEEGPVKDEDVKLEEYERATRYNYTSEEKYAFVEVISIIKSTAALMKRMEVVFCDGVARCVHLEVQDFTQRRLRDLLRFSVKKKKQMIKTVVSAIRDTCADWINNAEPHDDPALKGERDPKNAPYVIPIRNRPCGLSSTQLYMMRTMVESLISNKAANKKTMKKEMETPHFLELDNFYQRSFYYQYLLNFGTILKDCSDLPQFWYREFYLELGKKIQFPIEMSMPWILTDHILEKNDPSMLEYVLFPLDLYNDSANYALSVFKKQFLYDEIEAEVNLCFDQFVYKLSENIFTHFRTKACGMYLSKRFRDECSVHKVRIPNSSSARYETILKQRHVQLLGRSVDLNRLIRQRLALAMNKSIDTAIGRFESEDLTGVIELQTLLGISKLTHQMLSDHITLDSYDSMFREANNSVKSQCGRITLHIFDELQQDFLTNWCYNSSTNRFVRTTLSFVDPVVREGPMRGVPPCYYYTPKQVNQAYTYIHKLYREFIGLPHFQAICQLLGYQGIALIVEGMLESIKSRVNHTLLNYVLTLKEGMPPELKRPLYEYGAKGVFELYNNKLESIFKYADLTTNVFQTIREVGNAILFSLLIEQELSQDEIYDLLQASPFLGIMPRPVAKEEDKEEVRARKIEDKVKKMEELYSSLVITQIEKSGLPEQADIAHDSAQLSKERLCRSLSIFSSVLERIRGYLQHPAWLGESPPNGVMYMDECKEFHRLWSAMQLFIAMSPLMSGSGSSNSNEEWFGEGLHWASLTLIVVLGQQYKFESLDFSYHLLRVYEERPTDDTSCGISVKKLIERIRHIKLMNNRIFSILNKYISSNGSLVSTIPLDQVRYYPPPITKL